MTTTVEGFPKRRLFMCVIWLNTPDKTREIGIWERRFAKWAKAQDVEYMCWAHEEGTEGKHHLQIYMVTTAQRRYATLSERWFEGVGLATAVGSFNKDTDAPRRYPGMDPKEMHAGKLKGGIVHSAQKELGDYVKYVNCKGDKMHKIMDMIKAGASNSAIANAHYGNWIRYRGSIVRSRIDLKEERGSPFPFTIPGTDIVVNEPKLGDKKIHFLISKPASVGFGKWLSTELGGKWKDVIYKTQYGHGDQYTGAPLIIYNSWMPHWSEIEIASDIHDGYVPIPGVRNEQRFWPANQVRVILWIMNHENEHKIHPLMRLDKYTERFTTIRQYEHLCDPLDCECP